LEKYLGDYVLNISTSQQHFTPDINQLLHSFAQHAQDELSSPVYGMQKSVKESVF